MFDKPRALGDFNKENLEQVYLIHFGLNRFREDFSLVQFKIEIRNALLTNSESETSSLFI